MALRNRNMTQEVKPFDSNVERRLLRNHRTVEGDVDTKEKWWY